MFKTKTSVDRHVQEVFKKVRDENERNLRCYHIAKLYYQVGDYDSARRYLSSYLEVKNESAVAHKLLGQIYEALEQKESAFAQYKQSLELDSRQDDLVLKVCELLIDTDVGMDINRMKYWSDRASETLPNHRIVFELKEKILTADKSNANDDDLEGLITSELSARPSDIQLHIKLIKYYVKKNRLSDAFKHAIDVELTYLHRDNLIWYETLCDLLSKCKDIRQTKIPFWIFYVSSLERYVSLTLREHNNAINSTIQDATQALFNFDQSLTEAKQQNYLDHSILSEQMFQHMWGQLNYHLACLLIRKVKREQKNWIEIGRLCSALLLGAIHSTPIDLTTSWAINLKEFKELATLWNKEGSYRCSQAAHTLKDYGKDNPKRLMDKIDEYFNSTWRENIYRKIFNGKLHEQMINQSYFANSTLANPPLRLLSITELKIYDEIAKEIYPSSLHHHVWLGIVNRPHYDGNNLDNLTIYPNQYCHVFDNLQLSVFNLSQASPDTIGRLDIDAFLNATIYCAIEIVDEQQRSGFLSPDRMPTLPADLTNTICTSAQEKWWQYAYKIYSRDNNIDGDYGELRQEIQRGLEIVRCIGNHGLHINILVHLARLFYHRAELLRVIDKNHSDLIYLQLRYELYWSNAVPLLERLLKNNSIRMTTCKMFDYHGKNMTNGEISCALDEGRLILAQKYLRNKQYEQAIDALQIIKSPEASYHQGEIYKILADELIESQPRENLASSIKSQHIIMLTKARNCYYLTLDRLRSPGSNPNHPLNAELGNRIECIENDLKKIDPDLSRNDFNRHDCDVFSEESYSSAHSIDQNQSHNLILNNSTLGNISTPQRIASYRTPKQLNTPRNNNNHHHHHHHTHDAIELSRSRIQNEARPSPERLDAQLRQLIYSKDNMLTVMMDQIKILVDSNKQLDGKLEELRKDFANFRIETQQKRREGSTNNIDEHFATNDDYISMNFAPSLNNPGLNQPPPPSIPQIPNNLFAQAQRNPYSPMVYPPAAPPSLGNYYPTGLPFNDPHQQHLQSLYPHGVYPMPPIYPRSSIDQTLAGIPKISDMMQQGMLQQSLFHSHLMNHLTDFGNTTPQQQQSHLGQPLSMQMTGGNIAQNESINIPPISTMSSTIIKDAPVNKIPPVNVVITTSDTLPTNVSTIEQPTLSVTVPPQHRNVRVIQNNSMNNEQIIPHNYQISMPSHAMIPTTVSLPPLSMSIADTIALTNEKNMNTLNTSTVSAGSHNSSVEVPDVEYDPIPGFVPVIPLPDEIVVRTGEENEETLFCARAKLFRFVDKEWKDRGVGNVKLLRSNDGKVRLLMRREQVLKICANHLLTPDMNLQAMNNNDKAWIWVANDFADEEVKLEKLCIKFKLVEEAQAFKVNFDKAKQMISSTPVQTNVGINNDKSNQSIEKTSMKNNDDKSQLVVGGFLFKSPPIIQQTAVNNDEKLKKTQDDLSSTKATSKPSPFAGFSFVKTDSTSSKIITTTATTTAATTPTNIFSFVKTTSGIFDTQKSTPFTTTTQTTTGAISSSPFDLSKSVEQSSLRRPHNVTSVKSTMPISGTVRDDGKAVLYENIVTLLSKSSDIGDWNERGTGPLFILLDIKTGKLNVLIWNNERSKAYCNLSVTKSNEFTSMTAPNYVCWKSQELNKFGKYENYAILFNEINDAEEFRKIIDNCQRIMIGDEISMANIHQVDKQITISEQNTSSNRSFGLAFKPPPGSWECSSCYTQNNADVKNCVACTASMPSVKSVESTQSSQSNNQKPLSELFKPQADSWECKMCYIRNTNANDCCVACNSPNENKQSGKSSSTAVSDSTKSKSSSGFGIGNSGASSTFTFGIPKDTSQNTTTPTFSFGIQPVNQQTNKDSTASGFTFKAPGVDDKQISNDNQTKQLNFGGFGQLSKSNDKEFSFGTGQKLESTSSTVSGSFTFGTPGKNFDFQFQTKSPIKSPGTAGGVTTGVADVSEDEVAESEDIYFAPVIPLPDKIEIKTGEEDEEILYSHRAKLFRFDSNTKEWKERGLGDIKLLRHCDTKKLRLVMRRDHTLKLCLNHVVNLDLEITSKDEKTWVWNAADFSEGEIEYVHLACRFKTSEIAGEFKKSVESAIADGKLNETKINDDKNSSKSVVQSSATTPIQDLQVVYELKVSPEEKDAALKLQLPENFYSYKLKEDCPGCLGCKEPDHPLFNEKNKDENTTTPINIKLESPKLTTKQSVQPNLKSSINFGSSINNQPLSAPVFGAQPIFSSNITKDDNKSTEKSNFVFGPTSSQAKSNAVNNLFDKFSACSPTENKTKQSSDTTSIFGKSIFGGSGQTTLFGGSAFKSDSPTTTASTTPFSNFGASNVAATYTFGAGTKDSSQSFSKLAESSSVNVNTSLPVTTTVSSTLFKTSSSDSSPALSSGSSFMSSGFGLNQSPSIFDGVKPGSKSLFGGSTNQSDSTTTTTTATATTTVTSTFPIASGGLFSSATNTTPTFGSLSGPIFGGGKSPSTTSSSSLADNKIFGESTSIFGGKIFNNTASTFGALAATAKTNDNTSSKTDESSVSSSPFLNTDNITTFSTLAAASSQPVGFKTDPNFSFAGAGQSVFGSRAPASVASGKSSNQKSTGDDEDDDNNENEDYDPHYEPIIPLPDAVEVRTGEEDEEKIFCHRAKLYRYEVKSKEWKERGTGEMKLLYHPQQFTYRLLLRREQVHKVVCNLLLTPEIEFQPLKTSDRSWMWAGMNYTDDQFEIEKLAVKFKSTELAIEFKNAIDKAQNELRERQNNSQSLDKSGVEDYTNYRVEDDEDEGEDDEDEQLSLMFERQAVLSYLDNDDNTWKTFGRGQLKMVYDSDIFGARIIFEVIPGVLSSSSVITLESQVEIDGCDCTWTAIDCLIDPPIRRTFKASFTMEDHAQEMYINFQDGHECAKQADISESAYFEDQDES
ncbi:hypothetical protein PV327_009789 [Microctonus hyperodae]|uniref:E3 SUMO-protein ligase RanBP2-like n=1 Tax=Microctonus hyperodae TaxID=165561 RepID=A0AA39CB67_MICHY|nr:hypothetical protein PV327_009789 [Microctonus hyperodae]